MFARKNGRKEGKGVGGEGAKREKKKWKVTTLRRKGEEPHIKKTSAPRRAWRCNVLPIRENYDRQTNRLTDRATNGQTGSLGSYTSNNAWRARKNIAKVKSKIQMRGV